jgi:hypothetical protein
VHGGKEQGQSPRLADPCRHDGIGDTILSSRPGCHDDDARRSIELAGGASTREVPVVRHELCTEMRRSIGSAVKLQEEAVLVSPQTDYPISVWPQAPKSAGGRVAPFDQRTAALRTHCARQHTK